MSQERDYLRHIAYLGKLLLPAQCVGAQTKYPGRNAPGGIGLHQQQRVDPGIAQPCDIVLRFVARRKDDSIADNLLFPRGFRLLGRQPGCTQRVSPLHHLVFGGTTQHQTVGQRRGLGALRRAEKFGLLCRQTRGLESRRRGVDSR